MINITEMYRVTKVERRGEKKDMTLSITFDRGISVGDFADYIAKVYGEKTRELVYAKDCNPTSDGVKMFEVRVIEHPEISKHRSLFAMNGDCKSNFDYRALIQDKATEDEFNLLQSALEELCK